MKFFSISATFGSLIIAFFCSASVEDTLAFCAILSIGILHGANDLLLIKRANTFRTRKSYLNLFLYVLLIGLTAFLFYQIPQVALFVFVLFSAYHFGEQHWEQRLVTNKTTDFLFFGFYGLLLFCLLFYLHQKEVIPIIHQITSYNLSEDFLRYALYFAIGVTLFLGVLMIYNRRLKTSWMEELGYILLFVLLFKIATLLWAFATYFVIWHAIPSLKDQVLFLYRDYTKKSILAYVRSALAYWLIAIVALVAFIHFFQSDEEILLALFFSFLAAITFPHVLVIMGMHRRALD